MEWRKLVRKWLGGEAGVEEDAERRSLFGHERTRASFRAEDVRCVKMSFVYLESTEDV